MFHKVLIAYFGAFIFFWFLGIDQLFFLIFCCVGLFTYLSTKQYALSRESLFFALFIFATFFSVFQITTAGRYVTYIRNEGAYMAMLFIFLSSAFAAAREDNVTDKLYFALLIFSLQCSLVAFLASTGTALAFKSLAGYVIPDLGSKYIYGMLNKDSIQAEALWFSQGFHRPRGLMMYPNTMAGILASTVALKAYFVFKFWRDKFKIFAILCVVSIFMDIFSIYSSLSRSTWIGLAIALVIFPFAFKTNFVAKLIPALVGGIVIAFVFLTGLNEGIESRLVDKTHSNEGRGLNYQLIWEETTSSLDKLLFGHGTQIDHWLLDIPLGSHSTYLGVFFKYGVIGSICLVLFLFFLYRRSVDLTRGTKTLNKFEVSYIRPYFLCFALIIPVVQMMFIEVDVDLSYAMYFSALVFLIGQESWIVKERLNNLLVGETDIRESDSQSLEVAYPAAVSDSDYGPSQPQQFV